MSRPSRIFTALFVVLSTLSFAGCKTAYSDMYSPHRSYFKPVQEKSKASDLLPPPTQPATQQPPVPAVQQPSVPAPEAAPAPEPMPGGGEAIPGL